MDTITGNNPAQPEAPFEPAATGKTSGRGPRIGLLLAFLAILVSIPVGQAVFELRNGSPPVVLDLFRQRPTARHLRAFEKNLEDASLFAGKVRSWIQFGQFQWLRDGGEKALIGRKGWLFYKPGLTAMLARDTQDTSRRATNDPLPAIRAFRDDLAARGVRLLLVIAPNKESIYPDQVVGWDRNAGALQSRSTRELLARLRDAQVDVLDLFEVFSQARQTPPPGPASELYLRQDSHWSPRGVQLAARAVAGRLLDRGWVERGRVEYAVTSVQVRRIGDVLRMLQVPWLEREDRAELVPCEQVVSRALHQPYQDDPASPVLVLGDSFLRIYAGDEPGSAGFVAHLAQALNQPLSSLISEGGASTLVRQELSRRPGLLQGKRVVVWEFVERDIRLGAEGWQVIRQASNDSSVRPLTVLERL